MTLTGEILPALGRKSAIINILTCEIVDILQSITVIFYSKKCQKYELSTQDNFVN